tara:strand:+ start:893 stop:1138 length:246 start_codon:yes stop_codon:yes gene_type:complete
MPWISATFSRDTDSTVIGTLSCVYTDETDETFSFSSRYDKQNGKDSFVTKAKEALAIWIKKKDDKDNDDEEVAAILTDLNS